MGNQLINSCIAIAADSVDKLRSQDVYRVLDSALNVSYELFLDVEAYLLTQRQDLSEVINESVETLTELMLYQ